MEEERLWKLAAEHGSEGLVKEYLDLGEQIHLTREKLCVWMMSVVAACWCVLCGRSFSLSHVAVFFVSCRFLFLVVVFICFFAF